MKKLITALTLLTLILLFTGCQQQTEERNPGTIKITTTLFPLYDFVRIIGGDKVSVSMVIQPGVEPHSYEPTPQDIVKINNTDLFIYTGKSMEPWVEKLIANSTEKIQHFVDVSQSIINNHRGHDHGRVHISNKDPHIWLDPVLASKIVDTITESLIKSDIKNKVYYQTKSNNLKEKLNGLHKEIIKSLKNCKRKILFHGGHFTFGYFAKRYKIEYHTPYSSMSPDSEPSAYQMIQLIDRIKKLKVRHIFHEELINPRIAKTISSETGAELLLLHGLHNVSKTELENNATYISIMKENLNRIKKGLLCQ